MTGFSEKLSIAGRRIGKNEPCLIIAEAGVNHFGDLEKAFDLVDMAVEAGADVFKLQHYQTDLLVGSSAPEWRERLRSKELTDDQVLAVQDRCKKRGIIFLCTGHNEKAAEFLDSEAEVPAFKIGSGELGNWGFIQRLANRNKPIILSTGMYELEDIRQAISVVRTGGCRQLGILHCITQYPAPPKAINLSVIHQIRDFFPGPVGYSDHTIGTAVSLAAVAMGADIIEKHITIDRDIPNAQDWKVSCGPDDFPDFIADIRAIEAAIGGGIKTISREEKKARLWATKSLTATKNIKKGEKISKKALMAQRPGDGIPPGDIEKIIDKQAACDIPCGQVLKYEYIQGY